MAERSIFEAAILKSKIREGILKLVEDLDSKSASELVADVAVELHKRAGQASQLNIPGVQGGARRKAPRRPERALPGISRKDQAAELLRLHPGMKVVDIADRIYGSRDEKAQGKARTLLWMMKKDGLARNPAPGQWEVVEQSK